MLISGQYCCLWYLRHLGTNGSVSPQGTSTQQNPPHPQNVVFCSGRWAPAFPCTSRLYPVYLFSSSPRYQPHLGRCILLLVLGYFSSNCTLLTGTFLLLLALVSLSCWVALPLLLFALPRINLPCLGCPTSNKVGCSNLSFWTCLQVLFFVVRILLQRSKD